MSKIEVNQISSQCGSTLTIGQSGDTVTLACGATQTGFGRTGTVDWDTTAKTTNFTAVSGNGYFVNTTSGAITVTLPAGSAGDIVSLADYAATWQTNNVTVTPNGTDKIGGVNASVTLNTEGQSITLVYTDSTQGWVNTMDSTSNVRGAAFITATGGTVTCCGDYKIHTFTSPGTFCISALSNNPALNNVDYLVVAGGGGGGAFRAGGGGAGGYRESHCATTSGCYTASPLASATSLPVSVTGYPITIGGGGAANGPAGTGCSGSNSVFSTITSTGGGGGGKQVGGVAGAGQPGTPGGSGGGAGASEPGASPTGLGGSGNTPPVSPPQGNNGGASSPAPDSVGNAGAGGGGATQVGSNMPAYNTAGPGGNGATTSISASPTTYAGGGGGGHSTTGAPGGTGGGGDGLGGPGTAQSGTANTGGGGGGGGQSGCSGGAGGSGIVIIRYKYQ